MSVTNLSHDVLTEILLYLDDVEHTQRLRSVGSAALQRIVERRTSANFYATKTKTRSMPSELVSLTMLRNLKLEASGRHADGIFFEMTAFPRSLTRLAMIGFCDYSMVFVASDETEAASQIASLDAYFTVLKTLQVDSVRTSGYWALPSSLTRFIGTGPLFHENIPMPPHLAHIGDFLTISDATVREKLAPRLESILTMYNFQADLLPSLPSLTYIHIFDQHDISPVSHLLPSLRFALLPKSKFAFQPWLFPHLEYFSCYKAIGYADLGKIPQSITKWTTSDFSEHRYLQPVHPKSVTRLPRGLKTLRFSQYPEPPLSGIIQHLPSGLTRLDARGVTLQPSEFQFFPTTLTWLQVHNINRHNVIHLERLRSLIHLGWFDGVLVAKVVKQLPRRLQSLSLVHIGLKVRGHYQEPGSTIHREYTYVNPQVTALRGNLPNLRKLLIKPVPNLDYYSWYTSELLADLPTSLEELILDWGYKPINFFTTFDEKYRYSPSPKDQWIPVPPHWDSSNDLQPTTLFKNLVNLKHLFVSCSSPLGHDPSVVLRGLPPQIELLRLPRYMFERSPRLLSKNAYLPNLRSCSSISLLYLVVDSNRTDIKSYEGYNGVWPVEPEYSMSQIEM